MALTQHFGKCSFTYFHLNNRQLYEIPTDSKVKSFSFYYLDFCDRQTIFSVLKEIHFCTVCTF